jgi:DNA-binding GntR family transcriptional regulator
MIGKDLLAAEQDHAGTVTGVLRTMIADGQITGRVPSILTLAQEYGVSHRTSQRALTTLTDEGLIVAVRGKGFYVKRNQS